MMCLAVISSGCIDQSNPLLEAYDTPFQTPPFHKIRIEHFKPAFEQAIAEHRAEIDAIANNQEDATFENTIVALENAGKTLGRVRYVFSCLTANVKDDALATLSREMTPILTAHSSEMALNEKIFSRIKTLYDNRNLLNLDKLQLRTLEKTYDDYVRRGAALDAESKEKMKQLNSELAMATLAFSENVLKETKNFKIVIENQEELKGVPESVVKAAAETAAKNGLEGKWVLTVDKPCLLPVLTYSENRELR
ncbi:MAG: peptidase M3, partial [Rikenellaceae bacterium]|nr:peptidase M3 [Rikenellaceae bacterium]